MKYEDGDTGDYPNLYVMVNTNTGEFLVQHFSQEGFDWHSELKRAMTKSRPGWQLHIDIMATKGILVRLLRVEIALVP